MAKIAWNPKKKNDNNVLLHLFISTFDKIEPDSVGLGIFFHGVEIRTQLLEPFEKSPLIT